MAKKKRRNKKIYVQKIARLPEEDIKMERLLIENFISLQKVMVNLSVKFDYLTEQISKLLNLFEISAKVLAEKDVDLEGNKRDNARIIEKLESITEQNRTIARGLTLMHDKISGSHNYPEQELGGVRSPAQRLPFKSFQRNIIPKKEEGEYHKSISSNGQKIQ